MSARNLVSSFVFAGAVSTALATLAAAGPAAAESSGARKRSRFSLIWPR
jgi:hypothetical protein